jgi:predicted ATP-dependent serine protease
MDPEMPPPEQTFEEAGGTVVKMPLRQKAEGGSSEQTKDGSKKKTQPEWEILTPSQCSIAKAREYIIKGLIARGDHAQFIGQPGSGKSTLAPLAAYCIALGVPFLGRRVKQGPVLYLAAEDGHGMKLRVRALCNRLGDAPNFLLVPENLNLMDPNSGDEEKVSKLVHYYKPVAVFLDTVSRAFPGLRENESDMTGMGQVIKVARSLTCEECKPAVVTVHHVAKDGGITPRGHGNLHADLDVVMLIQGEKAEPRSVLLGKNRNGTSDATFSFHVETEDFGEDADGDLITAPIAAPVEGEQRTGKSVAEAKLNDRATLLLRELRDLVDRHAELIQPGEGYTAVRAITRFALRSRLIDRGWFSENLLCADLDGKPKLVRAGFAVENNGLNALKRRGLAGVNRDHVWLL